MGPETGASKDGSDPEVMELGRQIRLLRKKAGLTLEQLANDVGVTASLISHVERGKASPSLTTLRGIARTLGVSTASLFMGGEDTADADRDSDGNRVVVRRTSRKHMLPTPGGPAWELLTPDASVAVEFLWGEIEPGSTAPAEAGTFVAHDGEENVLCLEGELVMIVGADEFVLRPGDCLHFDCSKPHRAENRAAEKAVVVATITPPTF